ncbi:hypothetical protein CRE_23606 [Caenorhabditis remanei]|uniref:Uncharacterized protein n=1 Tax=Caenorhabditis remanei TaxID=31234 RepID=E3MVS4_CAERE|nr:hypothetical protein CRE_23606 [Caenorhabditis remanei]
MAPKKKRTRMNSSRIDAECLKQLNLLHVCGYCSKLVGHDEKSHIEHASSHENEIKQCRTCCIPLKPDEIPIHLKTIHPGKNNQIRFSTDKTIIELRIAAGKGFSNFWGICLPATDSTLGKFGAVSARWWNNFKNGRSLGAFRLLKSKFHWKCPICETKPTMVFGDSITMRAYAISHLEQSHFHQIIENLPGFFEFEWFHLNEEADFNVRVLMDLAEQRVKQQNRSYRTFYTLNLTKMQNGQKFTEELKRRNGIEKDVRFCLHCCSILPLESIKDHFRSTSHALLKAVPESTSFIQVSPTSPENPFESESQPEIPELPEKEEESFEFPRELFLYSTVYKNLRWDEFKWRCCLCPRTHALTFITQIIMRMYALRHIEQHHKFLFTEEFLTFEWLSLQQEMRASFDIRHYIPLQYTIKGEDTFNGRDPNDYMLPQQYYFLPKEYATNTVICGFCYRSFNRIDFFLHIVIHGFIVDQSVSCELRPVTLDMKVRELMGQNNYSDAELDDEPLTILSIDGKRLKAKMDLMNERKSNNMSRLSDITTPFKSEIDTDGEMSTPRSRKSAMDARRLLTETFKVLQANARNRRDTWNATSSSSSSDDDDNSEDERFEKKLEMESATKLERYERSKSREPSLLEKKKVDVSSMRPAEIREWIRREARRRGIDWTEDSDESTSSDDEDSGEKTSTMGKKWANMKLQDIKEKIRQAAKRRNVTLSSGSSSSDSDDS